MIGLIGGVLYRFRGGWPKIPRPIEQALFCSVFIYAMWGLPWYAIGAAYVLSVIFTVKGHGQYMDLASQPERDPEWCDWMIRPLKAHLAPYWYDVLGLALTGFFITLAPGLALLAYGHIEGLIILFSGILKAPAYMIGWTKKLPKIKIYKFELNHETAWGEFLTGVFIWGCAWL